MLPALLLFSAAARGQTSDPQTEAAARALFQKADAEMASGNYEPACLRFEEVKRIVPEHVNTGIRLAECYAALGRMASAWTELSRVRALAAAARKADKVELIDERLAEVSPRVPQLRVDVPAEVASIPGISIRRNGVELGAGQWGLPLPVDPGNYEIGASAPGRRAWGAKVEVKVKKARGEAPVVVTVSGLEADVRRVREPREGHATSVMSGRHIAGFVGIGLGAVGLGVGAALGMRAIARKDESNDGYCIGNACSRTGYDLRKEALLLADASTAVFVAGGLLVAGGMALVVLSSSSPKGKEKDGVATSLVIGPNGIGLRGAW